MKSERRLMVEFGDGSSDEYRIRNRKVAFRPRCRQGSTCPDGVSEWRQLAAEDISLHLALHTIVGEWLTLRLLKAAPQRSFRRV